MRFILAILLFPSLANALSFEASDNITSQGDAQYLKLDASNDPLTGTLDGTNAKLSGWVQASTGSFTGNAFSVGGSTFVVDGYKIGIGKSPVGGTVTILPRIANSGITMRESDDGNDALDIFSNSTNGFIQLRSGGTLNTVVTAVGSSYFNGGNVGIGTTGPQTKLTVSSATTATDPIATFDGTGTGILNSACYMIKLINAQATAISSGTIVMSSRSITGDAFPTHIVTTDADSARPLGVIQDVSCAAGAWCHVGVAGVCSVRLDSAETCVGTDDVLVTNEAGRAECEAVASVVQHTQEVGHPLQSNVSAGQVIKAVIHFN